MKCDVCGSPVEKLDSATQLSVEAGEMPAFGLMVYSDRHIRCSPSRAQYITQLEPPVVDERPEYDKRLKPQEYVSRMTSLFSNAYARIQNGCRIP